MSSLVNSVKVTKGPEQLHAAKGNPMHKRYRKRHHHQHVEGKKEEKKKIKKIYRERERELYLQVSVLGLAGMESLLQN